jgi:glutamate-5-semialdehyde dehydrogenase
LVQHTAAIIAENQRDIENATAAGIKKTLIDRLLLNEKRIAAMAEGLRKVARLDDPVGEVLYMKTLENGLQIGQKRVPIGVIAIIYEARPNVTSDAFGLCLKAGNSVILRGGKEAIHSNRAVVKAMKDAMAAHGFDANVLQLITDTNRETAIALMKMNGYVDVLIPRGSAGLIRSCVENATVPVIETGTGNCHIFVDASADLAMAKNIIINAKTQRPGVCNACEKVLLHGDVAAEIIGGLCAALKEKNVEMRGDERAQALDNRIIPAAAEDWAEEYLDLIIGIAVVDSVDDAIAHIRQYSSKHSESIITKDYANAQQFLNEIDSAAVYVNASTRFTDGEEFGLGAEIGISTQKLHARGPMGLKELTTTKYIIYGNGQIR